MATRNLTGDFTSERERTRRRSSHESPGRLPITVLNLASVVFASIHIDRLAPVPLATAPLLLLTPFAFLCLSDPTLFLLTSLRRRKAVRRAQAMLTMTASSYSSPRAIYIRIFVSLRYTHLWLIVHCCLQKKCRAWQRESISAAGRGSIILFLLRPCHCERSGIGRAGRRR